jgi:hypothetical protein
VEPKLFLVFQQEDVLSVRMGGFYNNHELQQHSVEAIEILKAKKLHKLLLDITRLEVLMNMSQVWIRETWYPKATDFGLTHLGIIVPMGFITPEDLRKMNGNYENNFVTSHFFESESEATDWLKKH